MTTKTNRIGIFKKEGILLNQEGYKDPTAEHAIHRAQHLPERIWEVIKLVRDTFRLVGMEIVDITVEDRKTKRKYKWSR